MATLSVPYPVRRLRRLLKRLLRRVGLMRLARYTVGLGLAAILFGVGVVAWLPLSAMLLAGLLALFVVTSIDFRAVSRFVRSVLAESLAARR